MSIALILALTLVVQTSDLPVFEAATVKPSLAGRGSNFTTPQARYVGCHGIDSVPETGVPPGITIPIGRCIARNVTLKSFIGYAYGVPDSQIEHVISGGPQWLNEPYDIEAKAEKPVSLKELKFMLQSLLRERFKMTFHRETREISVFDLIEVKGGAKVQPAVKDKECVSSQKLGPCHEFFGGRGRGLHAQSVSMGELAAELTYWTDRIVLDRTGLSGLYSIQTTPWTPDNPGPNFRAEAGTDPENLPTLFSMLPEQLGLRLEAKKEPVEIIVIDGFERPTG
jgi:uncharacterized protein (TIGR03435 family)